MILNSKDYGKNKQIKIFLQINNTMMIILCNYQKNKSYLTNS